MADAAGNEAVLSLEGRGLVSNGIKAQVAELTRMASHARTREPLYHIHADPPPGQPWSADERAEYWQLLEQELGLQGRPFAAEMHRKDGREHEHRVYLRIHADGRAIRMDHDYARREKVSRIFEFDRGEMMVKGAHNRAVIHALDRERPDVAAAMRAADLHEGPPARAPENPTQRAIRERKEATATKVGMAAYVAHAWAASDSQEAFAAALEDAGLRLARGDKKAMPMVVDAQGKPHELARLFAAHTKASHEPVPSKDDQAARIDIAVLTKAGDLIPLVQAEPARPAISAANPILMDAAAPAIGEVATLDAAPTAPVAMADQAHTIAPVAQSGAPSRDATAGKSTGGSGITSSAESTRPTGAALEDVGDGPGDPPGPGATINQQQDYRAKLAAYQQRKGKAWAKWVASQQTRPEATATINKGPTGEQDNAAIWKQATPTFGQSKANGAGALSLAIVSILRTPESSRNVADGHAFARGNTGDERPRPASRELSRSDGYAEPGRAADATPRDGRLPGLGADRGASVADGGAGIARPRIVALAENARIRTGLAACNLSGLRAARDALKPVAQVVVLQDRREAAAAKVMADRARIAAVLSTHPHPDPADLDPEARERKEERKARDEHTASKAADAAAAKTGVKAAFQNRGPVTWLRNVLLNQPTAKQQQALDAASFEERNANTRPDDSSLRDARDRGRLLAMSARDRVAAWEAKPHVAQALELARLNSAVDEAANVGDQTILRALKAEGPEAARLVIQGREESDRRTQDELERRQGMRPGNPITPGPGNPRTPGMK